MSKKCKIYYGTLINDGDGWARLGSHLEEPVKVEGRDPLGKEPEFCCKQFEELWQRYILYFYSNSGKGQVGIRMRDNLSLSQQENIRFCPFCGAHIILLEDLKLRAIKTWHSVAAYYVERQ